MGEIRIVGQGKTREYPYPVCKKDFYFTELTSKAKFSIWASPRVKILPFYVHEKDRILFHRINNKSSMKIATREILLLVLQMK